MDGSFRFSRLRFLPPGFLSPFLLSSAHHWDAACAVFCCRKRVFGFLDLLLR
jgi:hypothetical protein